MQFKPGFCHMVAVSVVLHTIVLIKGPSFGLLILERRDLPSDINVTYVKKFSQNTVVTQSQTAPINPNQQLKIPAGINESALNNVPFSKFHIKDKDVKNCVPKVKTSNKHDFLVAVKKNGDVKNNIAEETYRNYVLALIQKKSLSNYKKTAIKGSIRLQMSVLKNGTIKNIEFISKNSSGSFYLKSISLKSIGQLSPLPVFPRHIKKKEMLFDFMIVYKS